MHILLTLTLLSLPVQTSSTPDTSQIAALRYQLTDMMQKGFAAQSQRQGNMNAEVDSLKKVVGELQGSIKFYERSGSLLVIILTIVGLASVIGFIKRSTRKFDKVIDDAIFRIDPRDMPIKLPATGMEKQFSRLQRLNFRDLSTYQWLDENCTRHAVVVLATNDSEAQKLKQFILDKSLADREDAAFVVYTKGARITPTILGDFDNVTFANNHLTLVQALFVAARGMVR